MGKMIVFASGRGGEGKTTLAALLGIQLAERGHKVCIVDANVGMRCMDLYLKIQDSVVFDLYDLANAECDMEQALLPLDEQGKVYMLSSPQAMLPEKLNSITLNDLLKLLKKQFDYVLFDAPCGISQNVRLLIEACDTCFFVTKTDTLSQRCTERISYVAHEIKSDLDAYLLFNNVSDYDIGAAEGISLYLDIPMIGLIPRCFELAMFIPGEQSITECKDTALLKAIQECAMHIEGKDVPFQGNHARRIPWLSRIKR